MKHLFTFLILIAALNTNAACSIIISQINEDFDFQGIVTVSSDLGTVTLDPEEEEVVLLVEGVTVISIALPVVNLGGDIVFGEFEENGAAFMNAEPDVSGTIYSATFPSDCVACETIVNMPCEGDGDPTTVDRFDDMCNCIPAIFLPVELTFFDVRPTDDGNELTWVTASETDNEMFEIERSSDGVDWRTLGSIHGAGTSFDEIQYSFLDRKQSHGTIYYRLRQIDFDGQFELSKVISLELTKNEITVYPNPSIGYVNIDYPLGGRGYIKIYDLGGLLVLQTSIDDVTRIEIDATHLPSGIYTVTDEKFFSEMLIVNSQN